MRVAIIVDNYCSLIFMARRFVCLYVFCTVPGYPKVECEMVECPAPYMGRGVIPNTPPDASLPAQDPFGTGKYTICLLPRSVSSERHIQCLLMTPFHHLFCE